MSARADGNIPSRFSRPLPIEEVPPEGSDLIISATQTEREAIAGADGLEGLAKLEGSLHVAPWQKGGLSVTGEMRARITQICVVTLEPFETEVVEPIEVKFAAETARANPGAADPLPTKSARSRRVNRPAQAAPATAFEDDDPPDPIIDGRVDLGALVAEFLALSLDPYPRKPGVEFEPAPAAASEAAENPFAKLEALKSKLPRRRS